MHQIEVGSNKEYLVDTQSELFVIVFHLLAFVFFTSLCSFCGFLSHFYFHFKSLLGYFLPLSHICLSRVSVSHICLSRIFVSHICLSRVSVSHISISHISLSRVSVSHISFSRVFGPFPIFLSHMFWIFGAHFTYWPVSHISLSHFHFPYFSLMFRFPIFLSRVFGFLSHAFLFLSHVFPAPFPYFSLTCFRSLSRVFGPFPIFLSHVFPFPI